MNGQQESGGRAVLRFLEARTTGHVFGLPGSSSVPMFHEFPLTGLHFVPAVQENAALAAADGFARISGPTGVLIYMLPGAATAMSNLYNAYRDETPLIVIVSQQTRTSRWGQASVGEADIVEMVRPFTRFAREVAAPDQLVSMLEAAHRASVGPPSGPAVVVVPEDILRAPVDLHEYTRPRVRCTAVPADVKCLADRIRTAERPLIVVGGQLRRSGGAMAVEELSKLYEIPMMFEPFWNDRLGVSPSHDNLVGQLTKRSSVAAEADFVLALGCRMFNEVHPRPDNWFAPDAFVAHVNADAGALEQTFEVSWSCAADPGQTAQLLQKLLAVATIPDSVLDARRLQLNALRDRRRGPRRGPYADIARQLVDFVADGYLLDESVLGNPFMMGAVSGDGASRYMSTTGGSLGWAPAAAVGVALASKSQVTAVVGDGALFFGLQGLWAAAALQLPITVVVLDNGGFGSTRWFEDRYAESRWMRPAQKPSYVGSNFGTDRSATVLGTAEGLGMATATSSVEELEDVLAKIDRSRPTVVHVPIGQ